MGQNEVVCGKYTNWTIMNKTDLLKVQLGSSKSTDIFDLLFQKLTQSFIGIKKLIFKQGARNNRRFFNPYREKCIIEERKKRKKRCLFKQSCMRNHNKWMFHNQCKQIYLFIYLSFAFSRFILMKHNYVALVKSCFGRETSASGTKQKQRRY